MFTKNRNGLKALTVAILFCFLFSGNLGAKNKPKLDFLLLKTVIDKSIQNLELNPELHCLDSLLFFQSIQAQVHLTSASLAGKTNLPPEFYGLGMFFVARHFGRNELAQSLLLEERKFVQDILIKSWIDGELLKLERKKLYNNVGVFGRSVGFTGQKLFDSDELELKISFFSKPDEINKVLYSEKYLQDEHRKMAQIAETLKRQAETLASDGNLKQAVQKMDLSAQLIADTHKDTSNYYGPLIYNARQLNDLGLPFIALIRYKKLLINLKETNYNQWKAIIYEDMGDIFQELDNLPSSLDCYKNSLTYLLKDNNEEARLRLKRKIEGLAE